jgi:hypothetical protein
MCENPKPVDWFRIFYAYYTGYRFSSRQSCCQVQAPLSPPSAFLQARQMVGDKSIKRLVGCVAGAQPATQPDDEDGGGIHGKSAEFSHGVGLPCP